MEFPDACACPAGAKPQNHSSFTKQALAAQLDALREDYQHRKRRGARSYRGRTLDFLSPPKPSESIRQMGPENEALGKGMFSAEVSVWRCDGVGSFYV